MATVIKAIYEDGVFKPEEPVLLEEKTYVEVVIPAPQPQADDDDSTGWKAIEALIGVSDDPGMPTDIAENHDHYLYGAPKKR
jgi:predicted DNA-binding antitoxin AbrB/MazE fold protein